MFTKKYIFFKCSHHSPVMFIFSKVLSEQKVLKNDKNGPSVRTYFLQISNTGKIWKNISSTKKFLNPEISVEKFVFCQNVKTQRKVVSDFAGKKGAFPPLWPLFLFLGKKNFFGWKIFEIFFNEIGCKKFSIFFCNEFSSKKFSKFFYSQFHWKNILKFFQKIRKKFFALKKKRGHRGECTFFFFQQNPTRPFVGFWREKIWSVQEILIFFSQLLLYSITTTFCGYVSF